MILYNSEKVKFELRITNYQYPNILEGGWDSNWLIIYINVKSDSRHWQSSDACLTTWEIKSLISWMREISENIRPKYNNQEFTEPNLSFKLLSSYDDLINKIRVNFRAEFKPEFQDVDIDYFIDLTLDNEELSRIVKGLEIELSNFPER